jgi:cyanophycinase
MLLDKYHNEEFIYAGTSVGAAYAITWFIKEAAQKRYWKAKQKSLKRIGLIDGVIIDTHFVQRGRIGRLFSSCRELRVLE